MASKCKHIVRSTNIKTILTSLSLCLYTGSGSRNTDITTWPVINTIVALSVVGLKMLHHITAGDRLRSQYQDSNSLFNLDQVRELYYCPVSLIINVSVMFSNIYIIFTCLHGSAFIT